MTSKPEINGHRTNSPDVVNPRQTSYPERKPDKIMQLHTFIINLSCLFYPRVRKWRSVWFSLTEWLECITIPPSLDIFSNYWSWINFSRRGYFHLCQSPSMELTKRIPAQRTNSVAPSMIQIYVIQNNVLYYFYYYFFLWVAFVIWKYFLSRGSFRFPVSR